MSNSNSFSFDKKIFGIETQKHDKAESTGNLSLMERIKTMFSNEIQDKKLLERIKGNLQSHENPEKHEKIMSSLEQQLPKNNFFSEASKKNDDTSHSPIDNMLYKPVSKSKINTVSKRKKTKNKNKNISRNSKKTKKKKDHIKKPPWRHTGKNIMYKKLKNKTQNII